MIERIETDKSFVCNRTKLSAKMLKLTIAMIKISNGNTSAKMTRSITFKSIVSFKLANCVRFCLKTIRQIIVAINGAKVLMSKTKLLNGTVL